MSRIESWQLKQKQAMSLDEKEKATALKIIQWYKHWNGQVYVAFSGGKDSTVLLHQVRRIYPSVPAVFCDTGLEYPEIREFVKTVDNVVWLRPKKTFKEVIEKYGYPIISKEVAQKIHEIRTTKSDRLRNIRLNGYPSGHGKLGKKWEFLLNSNIPISSNCCYCLKKQPVYSYISISKRNGIIATMASDSALRKLNYLRHGCNRLSGVHPNSQPMSFWVENDVWDYIHKYNVSYSSIYDMGYTNTGCMFCMFGIHLQKPPNKFQLMRETHQKQWDYCIHKLGCGKVLDFVGVKYE